MEKKYINKKTVGIGKRAFYNMETRKTGCAIE